MDLGLEPRRDILQRCVVWQLANASAARMTSRTGRDSRTGKKMYRQKEPRGTPRFGARQLFRGGRPLVGPTPRSHAIELPKKVRALRSSMRLSAKAKEAASSCSDKASMTDGKTKRCSRASRSWLEQCAHH